MLQSNVSTASFYGVPVPSDTAVSFNSNEPKVSLWDLRNELKGALAGADAASGSVLLQCESVHRMLAVMREHVQHNRVQRALRKELQNAHLKAEGLAKEVQRLAGQLKMLQTPPTLSPATSACENGPAEATTTGRGLHSGGPKTPPPYWPASGKLPFAELAAAEASAHGSAALLSGGAMSSMGGKSLKSDGLCGDDAEALQGKKDERKTGDGMRQCASHPLAARVSICPACYAACLHPGLAARTQHLIQPACCRALHALADERKKTQKLEARIAELQAAAAAAALHTGESDDSSDSFDEDTEDTPTATPTAAPSAWGFISGLMKGENKGGLTHRSSKRVSGGEVAACDGETISEADIMLVQAPSRSHWDAAMHRLHTLAQPRAKTSLCSCCCAVPRRRATSSTATMLA
jgi:hypothetical protein